MTRSTAVPQKLGRTRLRTKRALEEAQKRMGAMETPSTPLLASLPPLSPPNTQSATTVEIQHTEAPAMPTMKVNGTVVTPERPGKASQESVLGKEEQVLKVTSATGAHISDDEDDSNPVKVIAENKEGPPESSGNAAIDMETPPRQPNNSLNEKPAASSTSKVIPARKTRKSPKKRRLAPILVFGAAAVTSWYATQHTKSFVRSGWKNDGISPHVPPRQDSVKKFLRNSNTRAYDPLSEKKDVKKRDKPLKFVRENTKRLKTGIANVGRTLGQQIKQSVSQSTAIYKAT